MPEKPTGMFYGIGVGPGPAKFLSVAAWEALRSCAVVFYPRATSQERSAALQALDGLSLPHVQWHEVPFCMNPDRNVLRQHYADLAETVREPLQRGDNVAYLTLGDALTFSTYGYLIAALREGFPQLKHRTYPGVTSFAALSAHFDWPLGEGKERVLILPCPDDMGALRADIETHDVVVLMKIGRRLPRVLDVLSELKIAEHCVFARRLGFGDELVSDRVEQLSRAEETGYLSTMLIRRTEREVRHEPKG
jgi:precorrin-2/cobalt-factor-2 C20-methyltransferase